MKSFDTYFKYRTMQRLNTKSTSLNTYAAMINLISDYQDRDWVTLYLFYSNTEKGIRLSEEGMNLIKPLIEKYKTWSYLENQYSVGLNELGRDFKPLKHYQAYKGAEAAKKEVIRVAVESAQKIRTSELAKMLGVSQNVASAFKRGETNRVSYDKILNSKLDLI